MALDPVPTWIFGAKHSGDILRQGTYNASNGAEGVTSPTAFRVRATPTPSNMVRVDPGGLLLPSPWDEGQTYSMRNASETLVEVPASSSLSENTWYINGWVNDPNKPGGTVPVSKEFGPYNFLTCDPEPKNNNPAYACAKIVVPKDTATVTQDMIEDLREMANPRTKLVPRSRPNVAETTETLTVTDVKGEWFPNAGAEQRIKIPSYATRAVIKAWWIQVREPAGNSFGKIWVEYGPWASSGERMYSTQTFDWNIPNTTDVKRNTWMASGDVAIPASIRGTEQVFVMKARLDGTSSSSARPQIDAASGVHLEVFFQEEADRSTT